MALEKPGKLREFFSYQYFVANLLEQVTKPLCAQANSAFYLSQDGKLPTLTNSLVGAAAQKFKVVTAEC